MPAKGRCSIERIEKLSPNVWQGDGDFLFHLVSLLLWKMMLFVVGPVVRPPNLLISTTMIDPKRKIKGWLVPNAFDNADIASA